MRATRTRALCRLGMRSASHRGPSSGRVRRSPVTRSRASATGSTVVCQRVPHEGVTMASSTGTRTAPLVPTGTWTVDPAHSSVEFSVKHMGIANVRGKFTEFEGTLEMQEDLGASRAHGSVKVATVDTGEVQRDDHLRSPDFFNVEEFPEITFESTRVEAIDGESSRVHGNLTMHGITREIRLEV